MGIAHRDYIFVAMLVGLAALLATIISQSGRRLVGDTLVARCRICLEKG